MGSGSFSAGLKRPDREADNSSPSSVDVKNGGAIPHSFLLGSTALLLGLDLSLSLLIAFTVCMKAWTGDQPVARPLPAHRTTQTQNKHAKSSMPPVGFEPTISVSERAKTALSLRLNYAFSRDNSKNCSILVCIAFL
jgi:hypothetical protein